MSKSTALNCEGCGENEADVECADCAPKGADSDPLPLCAECCARVHIGHGRLSRHRVTDLKFRKQQIELKGKFEHCQEMLAEVKRRKTQLNYCREDIDERVKMYERQIRENTMSVVKKIKSRALTLIKKMKEEANKRSTDLNRFEKYVKNNLEKNVNKIKKEINNLEAEPKDDVTARIKTIEEQIEAMDFSLLRDHLPSSCLEYGIDFDGVEDDIKALDFKLLNQKPATFIESTEGNTFYKDTLEEGCEMKLCIQSAVNMAGHFWSQPHYPVEVFDKLLDISHKIRQEYMCNLSWKPFESQDEELKVGALCCVLYPNDSKWYRGCIEDLRSDRKSATVRYLDFGNTAIHTITQILPYKCFVDDVPFQAINCCLSGISEDLSHDAKWLFNDMVKEKLLDAKFIKKETVDETRSVWLVELKLVKEDNVSMDVNQLVKQRAESKVKKEAISCRDIRLSDENLPSSFKVISSTVKSKEPIEEEKPGVAAESEIGAQGDSQETENSAKEENDTQEEEQTKETPPSKTLSQDIRNVVYKTQDIRNVLPKSEDARQTSSASQDICTTSGTEESQKTSSQDNRSNDNPSDQSSQEPVDEGMSFLSSIGCNDDDDGGQVVDSTEQLLGEFFQIQQQILNQDLVSESCGLLTALPATAQTVVQIESMSAVPSQSVSTRQERQGTWIPSGNSYSGAVRQPVGKPPASFSAQKSTTFSKRSLEQEAQAVVANIIQDVVSHFCVNGRSVEVDEETEDLHVHAQPNNNLMQDLACDLQSRGSDEATSESSTITPTDLQAEHSYDLDGKEQTSVKSLLTETEPVPIAVQVKPYPKLSKSVSSSCEDINVKDSALKPEIQDKSLGYFCGPNKEETEVKRLEVGNELQLLSLSTNNVSQLESMDLKLDHCGRQGDSFRPEEDVEHVQTCDPSEIDDISLFARLPRITFTPGSTFEVYVLDDMQADGSFNLQIARTDSQEAIFKQFEAKLHLQGSESSPCPVVNKGEIILALFGSSWYRAEVKQVNPDQTLTVLFVDYGTFETTYAADIRPVPDELLYVPNQSSRCSLASFVRPTFTETERNVFNMLVEDVKLVATVVAQGYGVLQVSLTLTEDGEAKDILKLVDKGVRDTSSSHQGQGDRVSQRISILQRSSSDRKTPVEGRVLPYPNLSFAQIPISPMTAMNYMYYPPPRPVMNYNPGEIVARRPTTMETYPSAPNNGRPNLGDGVVYSERPVCEVSPKPHDYTRSCDSPSQLREDAEPFNPDLVYISPLKCEPSLDQNIPQQTSLLAEHTQEKRPVLGGLANVEEPQLEAGPLSLTSEPMSSFFDEDAWNECDSNKWLSCDSLSETPKISGRPSLSRQPQQASGSSQHSSHRNIQLNRNRLGKQRTGRHHRDERDNGDAARSGRDIKDGARSGRDFGDGSRSGRDFGDGARSGRDFGDGARSGREFGDGARSGRDFGDGARSGNSSDGSDRGDKKRSSYVCYLCSKPGHHKNQCPQNKFDNNRSKGMRSSKKW